LIGIPFTSTTECWSAVEPSFGAFGKTGVRAARRAAGVDRRAGRDQELVVQERPAEGALEQVVGDDVPGRAAVVQVPPDRQLPGGVGAHG